MPYGIQTLLDEPLNQIGDNHVLNRGHKLTEAKYSKICFMTTSVGLKHYQTIKLK